MNAAAVNATAVDLDVYVSNLSGQGAHAIRVDIDTGTAAIGLPQVQGDWQCESTVRVALSCQLDRLPASDVERITLTLPEVKPTAELDINVTVTSRTPDGDMSNNTSLITSRNGTVALPDSAPLAQLAAAFEDKTQAQDDALAEVAVGGGGSASVFSIAGLLLLLVGQAGRRIDL